MTATIYLKTGFCKGTRYEFFLAGGEIPKLFSHRGEGAALSFHLPSVSVPDVSFDRNSTKHSWIQRVPLIELEELLQGVEELELDVKVILFPRIVDPVIGIPVRSIENNRKCWVEKCGVHLIMEKSKADSDIHGEKWDHVIDLHALGSLTTDDQRLESSLIREVPKLKIFKLTDTILPLFSYR
ncbi:hypothetical protein DKX38_028861 [Salix brachista]|uniref:Uncharacterized protein n=1 Tax=Salix brachista TaxID=2182728 RepID=A0A5N5J3K1_9ROSI|nr:hypothetical protein DKX38_028861 [Salix brachista]